MISGFTLLSKPDRYCYPWRESIQSFLPVVDELIVVYDVYGDTEEDKARILDQLKGLGVRVVSGVFDLRKFGWMSYGVMRTTGYTACRGDVVLMFDADGILHEADHDILREEVANCMRQEVAYGFWTKMRCYSPTRYWYQNKHSGWYNKKYLGDNFDFYAPNKKGIPNWWRLPPEKKDGKQLSARIFGYEHVFDTKEALFERIINYGTMADSLEGRPIKTDDEYIRLYILDLKETFERKGKTMEMDVHPKIIRPRLEQLTTEEFGHSFFGLF